jgi:hypothetical protein
MSNTQITAGSVAIEDGTKAAEDYAPARKVRVELAFEAGDDAGASLDYASQLANQQVQRLLGRAVPDVEQPTTDKPARKRRTRAEIEADKAAEAGTETQTDDDPLGLSDAATGASKDASPSSSEPSPEDDDPLGIGGSAEPEPAKEITDKELIDAITARNGILKAPQAIKKLVSSFNPPDSPQPFAGQIPQERRQEFLDALAVLKAE